MYRLTSDIKIGEHELVGVVELSIESSWENLTDTCSLKFPRNLAWKGKSIAWGDDSLFKRGDVVKIDLGYDDNNTSRFEGYLHDIQDDVSPALECQDAMWLLKQTTITQSWKEVSLKELLSAIIPIAVPFDAPTVRLGQFRISKATPAQVLEELRKTYFLKSWIREGVLYVGLAYVPKLQNEHTIKFERNVISHDLKFRRKEDVKIKLKVISMLPNNQKLEFEFGDDEGEQRTLHFYDKKEDEIKFIAEQEIERLRYEGYRGSFTTFLIPKIQHGDWVNLESEKYGERNGKYLVKKVTTNFGTGGGRQIIELDSKA